MKYTDKNPPKISVILYVDVQNYKKCLANINVGYFILKIKNGTVQIAASKKKKVQITRYLSPISPMP